MVNGSRSGSRSLADTFLRFVGAADPGSAGVLARLGGSRATLAAFECRLMTASRDSYDGDERSTRVLEAGGGGRRPQGGPGAGGARVSGRGAGPGFGAGPHPRRLWVG